MSSLAILAAVRMRALLVAASVAAAGCGGNEFVLAPGDTTGVSQDSGSASDGEGGVVADYCQALRAYYSRCQNNSACDQKNLANCGAYAYALSEAARSAFIACHPVLQCATGQNWFRESCVSARLAAAMPTMAQTKLANDYCGKCMQSTTTGCNAASFFKEGFVAATDGPGFAALLYNDMVVLSIDQTCANAVSCDPTFRYCENVVVQPQVPVDACKD
jgi:hypothetical protein